MELRTAEEELGKELAEVYKREYQRLTDRDSDLLYMPATDKAKWWCSCGVMNLISQMHCRVCGASIADLSKIMWKDYLQGLYDKEHPEEAKARKEAEAAAAEKAAAEEAARAEAEKAAAEEAAEEAARLEAEKAAAEEAARIEAEKAAAEEAARTEAEKAAAEEAARLEAEKAAAEEAARAEAEKAVAEEEAEAEDEVISELPEIEPIAEEEPEEIVIPEVVEEEPEDKIEISIEEPAEEPVMLTASRPDEPEPEMLSITKEDEPEMGKIGSMDDNDNEYEDTRLGESEDDSEYFDTPKGATPDADTVLGIPSETEEANVSLSADISFPDSEDEDMTESESANIIFADNTDADTPEADIADISFPSDLAQEYAQEFAEESAKEVDEDPAKEIEIADDIIFEEQATPIEADEPMTVGIDDMMADIGEIEEPEPEIDDEDEPLIKLEKALEMPGFGKVQSLDALPEEESVEFFDLPDEPAEETVEDKPKKGGLFAGLFGKKKKEKKQPEIFTELKLKEEEPIILKNEPEPVVETTPEPEPEPEIVFAEEPEEIDIPEELVSTYEEEAKLDIPVEDEEEEAKLDIPAVEEDEEAKLDIPVVDEESEEATIVLPEAEAEELPEIELPEEEAEELPEIELPEDETEELPEIKFPEPEKEGFPTVELSAVPQGEIPDLPFSSEKTEEPSVIHDEEGNPQIIFPDSPSSESRFGDIDELDFPDATIPESPLPDPIDRESLPHIEFPDGPQLEVKMNPEPENKEKARPFRNPGAAKETPSGLTASEEKSAEAKESEAEPTAAKITEEIQKSATPEKMPEPEKAAEPQAPSVHEKSETVTKSGSKGKHALVIILVVAILAVLLMGFFLVRSLFGNSEATSAVEAATASIQKLEEDSIPTQEDFNKALNDYNAVPYDRKNEVKNASILERFKDVDLKTVKDIATRMDALSETTPFSDVVDLENEYQKLTVQEKTFVDGTKLDSFKNLNDMEQSALKAVSNIMSLLPSSDNFKVTSVRVKDDTSMSMAYRMQIGYSYVDEQGTLKQNTTYLSMMSANDDVAYNDAVNSGDSESYTKNTKEKATYDKCESDEVEVDSDKMMYYLDS